MNSQVLENKRKQHAIVTSHKRRIRDEVNPQLRAVKRAWRDAANKSNQKIKRRWHEQKTRVQRLQNEQTLRHKVKILAHRRRIRDEIAKRS